MKFRIAIWAGLGFLVAVGWAVYCWAANSFYANPSPIAPTELIVWNLAFLTQPIALASVRFRFGISVNWVILANTLTYGIDRSDRGNNAAEAASPTFRAQVSRV